MKKIGIGFIVILLVMISGLLTAYKERGTHQVKAYKNGLFVMKEVGIEHV